MCTLQLDNDIMHELGLQIYIPDENESKDNIFIWLFNTVQPRLREQWLYYHTQIVQYNAFKISREFRKIAFKLDLISRYLNMIREIKNQIDLHQEVIISFNNNFDNQYKLTHAIIFIQIYK